MCLQSGPTSLPSILSRYTTWWPNVNHRTPPSRETSTNGSDVSPLDMVSRLATMSVRRLFPLLLLQQCQQPWGHHQWESRASRRITCTTVHINCSVCVYRCVLLSLVVSIGGFFVASVHRECFVSRLCVAVDKVLGMVQHTSFAYRSKLHM